MQNKMPECNSNTTLSTKAVLTLYQKYENLAPLYARKIFGYDKAGYEFEDILQEFKIKIYTSILAYKRKWEEFKKTGRYKPIPLEIYLKSALSNRMNDFIKQFNNGKDDGVEKISLENKIDIGYISSGGIKYSFKNCTLEINGINLCEGLLTKDQKRCFLMYAQGFSLAKIQKAFAKKFNSKELIKKQVERLSLIKKELYDIEEKRFEYFLQTDEI